MNGMQHTHIPQNGRMLRKLINTVAIAIVLVFILSSCSSDWLPIPAPGRGDWGRELISGYEIRRVSSRQKVLKYRESQDYSVTETVIQNFYVTAYQTIEPYICVEGIKTESWAGISDEELEKRQLIYYLVDTTDGEVVGPYESYDSFCEYCSTLGLDVAAEWESTSKSESSIVLRPE